EVREKSIRVFDIAASALILREAGGDVVTLSGEPLDMPFDLSARSNFLAFGDRAVKEVII
ncbi:MAG: inositol monophosphatase family protein, partial [Methanomassiliicoccales archaeon]